jgi:hypothetical protein
MKGHHPDESDVILSEAKELHINPTSHRRHWRKRHR